EAVALGSHIPCQKTFGERRPLVGHACFAAYQSDLTRELELAQRHRGLCPGLARTDDHHRLQHPSSHLARRNFALFSAHWHLELAYYAVIIQLSLAFHPDASFLAAPGRGFNQRRGRQWKKTEQGCARSEERRVGQWW